MTSKIFKPHLCSWNPVLTYLSDDRKISVFDSVYTLSESVQLQKSFRESEDGEVNDKKLGKILLPLVMNGINTYKDSSTLEEISTTWKWSWNFKEENFKGDLNNSTLFLLFAEGYKFNIEEKDLEFQSKSGRMIIFENDIQINIKNVSDEPSLVLYTDIEYHLE